MEGWTSDADAGRRAWKAKGSTMGREEWWALGVAIFEGGFIGLPGRLRHCGGALGHAARNVRDGASSGSSGTRGEERELLVVSRHPKLVLSADAGLEGLHRRSGESKQEVGSSATVQVIV